MSFQSHRRTLPLATALLALALSTPAVPAIAAGNNSTANVGTYTPGATPAVTYTSGATAGGAYTPGANASDSPTQPSVPGPPTWPVHPQPIKPVPAAHASDTGGGPDRTTIGLGIAGSLLAIGGIVGIARRSRRIERARVTA